MNSDFLAKLDAITEPVCAQCGGGLGTSVSDDFCSDTCQQKWTEHANDVERLTSYREAASPMALLQDSARFNGHEAVSPDLDGDVLADLAEAVRQRREFRRRSKRRFRLTIGATAALWLTYIAVTWLLDLPTGAEWIVLAVYVAALVALNVESSRRARADRRTYLDAP